MLLFFIAPEFLILEAVVIPYGLKMIVDTVTSYDGDMENILQALAPALWLVGGSWVTMIIVFRGQEWWQCYIFPYFEADLRMAMFGYTKGHSNEYFANHFAGSLANKITDMVNAIESLSFLVRWQFINTLSVVFAALVMMYTVSPLFSLMTFLYILLNLMIIYPLARKADTLSVTHAENRSVLSGKIVDAFSNIINIRLFAQGKYEDNYLEKYQDISRKSHQRLILLSTYAKMPFEITSLLLSAGIFYVLIGACSQLHNRYR